MKKITYRTQTKKLKTYWWKRFSQSLNEVTKEHEKTVQKSFDYVITQRKKKDEEEPAFIDIITSRNTKKHIEFFKFKVSGKMLIRDPKSYKSFFVVTYTHILEIELKHKGENK